MGNGKSHIYISTIRVYNWLQCNLKKQGEAWCQCNLHCKNENKERSSTWSLCDAACWFKQCSLVSLNILRGRELDKAQLIKALQQIRGRSCCGTLPKLQNFGRVQRDCELGTEFITVCFGMVDYGPMVHRYPTRRIVPWLPIIYWQSSFDHQ